MLLVFQGDPVAKYRTLHGEWRYSYSIALRMQFRHEGATFRIALRYCNTVLHPCPALIVSL